MGITDVAVIVALVLAAIDQVRAKGQSTTHWSIILICLALLWHLVPQ